MTLILESANWDNQNIDHVIKTIHESETKIFHQTLTNEMQSMSRLEIYCEPKNGFDLERYVNVVRDRKQSGQLAKKLGWVPYHYIQKQASTETFQKMRSSAKAVMGSWRKM